jgi:hypothetical protein
MPYLFILTLVKDLGGVKGCGVHVSAAQHLWVHVRKKARVKKGLHRQPSRLARLHVPNGIHLLALTRVVQNRAYIPIYGLRCIYSI